MQTEPPPTGNLPTRLLGKTGVRVSVLGFGTAACGYRRNVSNAVRLYNEALDAGVTYFDTAPNETGYGIARRQLAPFLRDRRAEVFLVTKCHTSDGDEARRLLDRSLREMGTHHADLVHVHSLSDLDPDRVMRNGGILPALERAKRDGLLRFIGLSGHSRPAHFRTVLGSAWGSRIDVIMCAVNFADRHTYDFEGKVLPLAAKRNLGIAAMKVFGGADGRGASRRSPSPNGTPWPPTVLPSPAAGERISVPQAERGFAPTCQGAIFAKVFLDATEFSV
jgi:aryl-alcohol dehydrogenase-like predicted oxidoreductase